MEVEHSPEMGLESKAVEVHVSSHEKVRLVGERVALADKLLV